MLSAFKANDEEARLSALDRLQVLDTPPEDVFEGIVSLVTQILQVPISAISLVDRRRQWFKAQRGLAVFETPRDLSFCSHGIASTNPFIIGNALEDERFAGNALVTAEPSIRSYAGVPLRTADGYNIGALCAIDTKPRQFSRHEISMLENLAKLAGNKIESRDIASIDALTGAISRHAWMETARQEVSRAQRHQRKLSLAIFDVDNLKMLNQSFGYKTGDYVIKLLASCCMARIRAPDELGRIGGEELGLLMPETPREGAEILADSLRACFRREASDFGAAVTAAVSVGVTELRAGDTLESLMERAHEALCKAKAEGRNRTVSY
jgi:diguanylate cyclase (GGDEF)-like protein